MRARDFALLMACCLVWGVNLPLTRVIVAEIPPIMAAALRFAGLALVLAGFLRPVPRRQLGLVVMIGLAIGGLHFVLLFLGLANAPSSAVAIVGQLGLPMVTIMSVLFLGEVVRWRRMTGMALAFAGVVVILWNPDRFGLEAGLLFVVAAAFVGAVGTIMMKRLEPVPALNLQAWVGLVSILPLVLASAVLETGQIEAARTAPLWVWAGLAFSVLVVSVFGHSAYYALLKKYDVTLLAPLTLMTPVCAVLVGVVALGEPVTGQLLLGGAVTLLGVGLVAARENRSLPPDTVSAGQGR